MYPNVPLQIIWSGILMLAVRTERAYVAGRVVDEAVTYHLVLALEAFAAFGAWASRNRAVVRSVLGVDVRVRAGSG